MSLKETLKMAIKSFQTNKMRTFLSVLGIVIGVASVIILVAVGTGAQKQVTEQIGALGSNLITVSAGYSRGRAGRVSRSATGIFTLELANQMKEKIVGIKNIVPTVETMGLLIHGNTNIFGQVIAVTPAYEEVVDHHPVSGRYIHDIDLANHAKVVVLGSEVAEDLFGEENPIGREITISVSGRRMAFTVVGVMESKGQVMFSNFDNRVYIPVTTALTRILNSRYVTGYSIQAESAEMAKLVVDQLEFFLSRRVADVDRFRVMSQDTILETVSAATGTMTLMLGAIAGIALVVGGIGIMNIMLVTVSERTREIGIRKAIGAKNRHILIQFLVESISLSGMGGLLGLVVGFVGGYGISKATGFPFAVSWFSAFIAIGFSTMVGLFFGIFPAMKASRLDPVVALRYE